MEAEPNQLVSPSDPGSGTVDEGAPSITLGLGIGSGLVVKEAVAVAVNVIFTAAQLRELEQQWLIFKYIAAGLPVPLHLAVPIWKSIAIATANSSGSARLALCHQYPNFIGFSLKGLDYRSMMDLEPWRCRRTDGKKWRCSKNVVPDQKYCERHMHRGRQRSRKPVEASQNAVSSNTAVPTNSENLNTKLSIATPVNLQLMTPLSTSANHSIGAATSNELNRTVRQNKNIATTISITNYENDKNNHDIYRKNRNHVDNKDFCVGDSIIVGKSIGLSFSPNSVLQVVGYRSVCCGKGKVEVEAGRCRRTDGKKWRCSRDVVPNEKYCGRHMHRGVKKPVTISSPQLGANDEKVSTSSSSSDTTITDASITAACENV